MITRKQKLDFINTALQGDRRKTVELKHSLKQGQNKEKPKIITVTETNDDGSFTYKRMIAFKENWEQGDKAEQRLTEYENREITAALLEKILVGCTPKF